MRAETADPYRVLGVARTASPAEVRRAYLRLARAQASGADAARARQIDDAYLLLSDPAARWRYDESVRARGAKSSRWGLRAVRGEDSGSRGSPAVLILLGIGVLFASGVARSCSRGSRVSEAERERMNEMVPGWGDFQRDGKWPEMTEAQRRALHDRLLQNLLDETKKLGRYRESRGGEAGPTTPPDPPREDPPATGPAPPPGERK